MDARGFPAFPAAAGGRAARTWWGRAWVAGLEDSALDGEQLRLGRRLARAGRVGSIAVGPGRLSAVVHDPVDDASYATTLRVPELSDADWDRFAFAAASESGHLAALLDGEVPAALAAAAADAGVHLVPGIGEFDSECGCPGWEMPCRHAAAVAYQAAWLLDADPFVLLLVRGRDRADLVPADAGPPAGVPYAEAARPPAPLPDPPPPVSGPVRVVPVPPAPGVDPEGLALLVADAALRARDLLARYPEADEEQAALSVAEDAVRFAATHPAAAERLAGVRPDLDRAVAAWRHGGADGLRVLDGRWRAPAYLLARGRDALHGLVAGEVAAEGNHVTAGALQVRAGRDGRWYPYRERAGLWWPVGAPSVDAGAAALTAAD